MKNAGPHLFSLISQRVQKPYLSSRMLVQLVKVEPQQVEVRLRGGRDPTVTCHALNAND